MRTLSLILTLCCLLCLSAAFGQSPAEPPASKPSAAVQTLLDKANKQAQAKQFPDALQTAQQALTTAHTSQDTAGEAQAQQIRAQNLQALDRNDEAAAAWQAAAAAWEQAGDGPGRIQALGSAAVLLIQSKPDQAKALLDQALGLGQVEMKRPLGAVAELINTGVDLYYRGGLVEAEKLLNASLKLSRERAPDSLLMANCLNALGSVVDDRGDLAAAESYHKQALAIRQKIAPNSLDVARSLNNLGIVCIERDNFSAALAYFKQSLAIKERLAPGSLGVANSLNSLGVAALHFGDLASAENYHRQALVIFEKLAPGSLQLAYTLSNLGDVVNDWGDFTAAEDYYRRSLALFAKLTPNSLEISVTLNDLGVVAHESGDLAAAENYYKQALAIQQKLAPNSIGVAVDFNNLGLIAKERGDLSTANVEYEQALNLYNKLTPGSIWGAESLENLGVVREKRGNFAAAQDYFKQSLAIKERLAPGSLGVLTSLQEMGQLAYKRHDLVNAQRYARQAWDIVRRQTVAVSGDEAQQAFGTLTASIAADLLRVQLADHQLDAAFTTLEQSRAQALQQLLLERRLFARSKQAGPLWSAYQQAVKARDQAMSASSDASVAQARARRDLAAAQASNTAPQQIVTLNADLQQATQRFQAAQSAYTRARSQADLAWSAIKQNNPRAFVSDLPLAQALQQLPAGTLLAAFSIGEEQSALFLAGRKGHPRAFLLPITGKALQQRIHRFRLEVTDRNSTIEEVTRDSRHLFTTLFPPAARKQIASTSHLLLSPDGLLWQLPFAALVTHASGSPRYLGQDTALTYTQSLSLFARIRLQPRPLATPHRLLAVVVGDPRFDRKADPAKVQSGAAQLALAVPIARGERGQVWFSDAPPPPLPATRDEALQVAQLYATSPLLGEAATEAALRQRIQQAEIIHLATHGYLNPAVPMASGILLTPPLQAPPPGQTDNDGILQAWEIFSQLHLRAELCVLSACETGLGRNVAGEGVIGLTRALQYAGCRSIVASQWSVPDESTSRLMVAFHKNLRAGLSKDEALRRAMAAVRADPRTTHPYYWAAFFLTGDPDPLASKKR